MNAVHFTHSCLIGKHCYHVAQLIWQLFARPEYIRLLTSVVLEYKRPAKNAFNTEPATSGYFHVSSCPVVRAKLS